MSWQKDEFIYLKYITLYIYCIYKAMVFKHSPRLHLFDQKYSKNSNIVKYYYYNSK